jgi:hypothetical protein
MLEQQQYLSSFDIGRMLNFLGKWGVGSGRLEMSNIVYKEGFYVSYRSLVSLS